MIQEYSLIEHCETFDASFVSILATTAALALRQNTSKGASQARSGLGTC